MLTCMRGHDQSMAEVPEDFPHTLVPLALAAQLVFVEVYGPGFLGARAPTEEKLDAVATAISALVPIFEHGKDSADGARVLREAELFGGRFRRGAKELQFTDGKRARRLLAVSATDVSYVIRLLKEAAR